MKCVTSSDVYNALKDENWCVVDTRSSHAFLGWRLEGEPREGHIKGCTDFSANWITSSVRSESKREHQLNEKIASKGLTPDKHIILYDVNGQDASIVAEYLRNKGIKQLYYYNFLEWDGELEFCPNYSRLVPPQWIKEVLDGGKPEHFAGGDYKIFEISWGNPTKKFLTAHIPESVHIDSEEYEPAPKWSIASDEELERFACNNGITKDTTVILYCMDMRDAASGLDTALRYMGVKNVHCLNGTMQSWLDMRYPTESGNPPKRPCERFGVKIPQHPEEIVNIDEVKKILKDPSLGQIIDMRTWAAFIGVDSEYDYVPIAGRIPGTIWVYDKYHYTNPDMTMCNPNEIVEDFRRGGVDFSRRPVFFCGNGAW